MRNERPSRLRHPGRRALLIGLAVVMILLGVGGGLWLAQQPRHDVAVPDPGHVSTLPNQGNSLLYLSASGEGSGYMDTLTMLRTSDGTLLWQYQVPGAILGGNESGGAPLDRPVQIVNGVIYFAVDADASYHPSSSSLHRLVALRVNDGTLLWQHQIQTRFVVLVSVSDGVACFQITPLPDFTNYFLTLQCYRADTGAFAWENQWSDLNEVIYPPSENPGGSNALLYFVSPIPVQDQPVYALLGLAHGPHVVS